MHKKSAATSWGVNFLKCKALNPDLSARVEISSALVQNQFENGSCPVEQLKIRSASCFTLQTLRITLPGARLASNLASDWVPNWVPHWAPYWAPNFAVLDWLLLGLEPQEVPPTPIWRNAKNNQKHEERLSGGALELPTSCPVLGLPRSLVLAIGCNWYGWETWLSLLLILHSGYLDLGYQISCLVTPSASDAVAVALGSASTILSQQTITVLPSLLRAEENSLPPDSTFSKGLCFPCSPGKQCFYQAFELSSTSRRTNQNRYSIPWQVCMECVYAHSRQM